MKAPRSWPDFLDYLQGKVKVDEYVTHHRTLSDLYEGFNDMHVSRFIPVTNRITHDHSGWRLYPLRC